MRRKRVILPYGQTILSFGENPIREGYFFVKWEYVPDEPTGVNPPSLEENVVRRDMVIRAI